MSEMIILVGNIASGKTTITKILSSKYVIVSRDSLRYGIGAGEYKFDKELEPAIRETALCMAKELLKTGRDLVIDETNVTKRLRAPYIEEANRAGYTITAMIMPKLSKKESIDRRMKNPHDQNPRKLWESVWSSFDMAYEEPDKSEGFSKIIRIG